MRAAELARARNRNKDAGVPYTMPNVRGGDPPISTDDMRILDAKRHLGCVFHLRTPGVSTMIGFSKKIQSSLDGAPRLLIARDISDTAVVFRRTSVPR